MDKLTATVYLFTYNVPVDLQLIDDSVFDVDGWLTRRIGRGWGRTENKYGLMGTGSSQPTGAVYGSTAGTALASATAITADEVVGAYFKLPGEYRDNPIWIMAGATEAIVRKLQPTTNPYAFIGTGGTFGGAGNAMGTNDRVRGTGWLINPSSRTFNSEYMDALAASKKPVFIGNIEAGYAIAERKLLTVLRDPYSSANKGLVQLWFYVREGMGIVNATALYHLPTPTA